MSTCTFVALSDTHTQHQQVAVPDADVLLHAGDFTYKGTYEEVYDFYQWLRALPHRQKVVVSGNHELELDEDNRGFKQSAEDLLTCAEAQRAGIVYLKGSSVHAAVGNFKIWASPCTPSFWGGFQRERGAEIRSEWDRCPTDVDVLMTHGPPWGLGDAVGRRPSAQVHVGCRDLHEALAHRLRDVAVTVSGHIHEGYGVRIWDKAHVRSLVASSTKFLRSEEERLPCDDAVLSAVRVLRPIEAGPHSSQGSSLAAVSTAATVDSGQQLTAINAAACTLQYKPLNRPIQFTLIRHNAGRTENTSGSEGRDRIEVSVMGWA